MHATHTKSTEGREAEKGRQCKPMGIVKLKQLSYDNVVPW